MTAKTLILVATPLLKCFVLSATPCGKFENKKSVTSSLEWRELSRAVWMSFIHLIEFILLIGVLFASEMAENLTGYGPSSTGRYNRLLFDGDERKYEQWEVKFLGYMRLRKLKDVITAKEDEAVDGDKMLRRMLN